MHTLESSLWCFMNTNCYHESVLKVVNFGGDTDTIAALTGALAATYYRVEPIPFEWKKMVQRCD